MVNNFENKNTFIFLEFGKSGSKKEKSREIPVFKNPWNSGPGFPGMDALDVSVNWAYFRQKMMPET